MLEDEVKLNRLAQGIERAEGGTDWFRGLSQARRREVFAALHFIVAQAHPIEEEVAVAIQASGLRPTSTPCVLLAKSEWPLRLRLQKISKLPAPEHEKALRLLIALLGTSDSRRRAACARLGCSHWWHRDLRQAEVMEQVLSMSPGT